MFDVSCRIMPKAVCEMLLKKISFKKCAMTYMIDSQIYDLLTVEELYIHAASGNTVISCFIFQY